MSEVLHNGENRLEITVVDSWQDLLIADRVKTLKECHSTTSIWIRVERVLRFRPCESEERLSGAKTAMP
jgi:hypothetical protein